jgi:hypothetical protein
MATTQSVQPNSVWNAASRDGLSRRAQFAAIEHTIRHTTLRGIGFIGLLAVALIHLLDVFSKFDETPYLGVMYILLMISSIAVAFAILHTGRAIAWVAAGTLAALTLIGFVLSRTTGLPASSGDIGNWKEPLGVASMFVEAGVILLSGYALAIARRERHPGVHEALPIEALPIEAVPTEAVPAVE